jgi:hypothetical protein
VTRMLMMMITAWLGQSYFPFLYNRTNGLTSTLQTVTM